MRYYNYYCKRQSQEVIRLIGMAIDESRKSIIFFNWLMDNIPSHELSYTQTQGIRKAIEIMRDNKTNHNRLLKEMYRELTGMDYAENQDQPILPLSFAHGLTQTLLSQYLEVKKYEKIRAGLTNQSHRDILFSMINDEQIHASVVNYIYTTVLNGRK